MNEQELQQQFILWLAQKVGAITEDGQVDEQALQAAIQELGEEGLKQAQQAFMQEIQQQQVQSAKLGAKLDYIDKLRKH